MQPEHITITCDRCKKLVYGVKDELFTGGYYETSLSIWAEYANTNEKQICDDCMHKHPRYLIEQHGKATTFTETMLYVYNVKEA
jgi:two-component SAPR family response regulator